MSKQQTDYRITKKGLFYKHDLILVDKANNATRRRRNLLKAVSILEQNYNTLYSVDKNGTVHQTVLSEVK